MEDDWMNGGRNGGSAEGETGRESTLALISY